MVAEKSETEIHRKKLAETWVKDSACLWKKGQDFQPLDVVSVPGDGINMRIQGFSPRLQALLTLQGLLSSPWARS